MNSMRKWTISFLLIVAAALGLASCGGGDSGGSAGATATPQGSGATDSLVFSGVAARGAPIANAPVEIQCASGFASAATDSTGRFQLAVDRGALPCVARVTQAAGNLHSVAANEGVMNITPLTELVTASVAREPTGEFFTTFNNARADRISDASIAQAQQAVRAALASLVIDPALDFIRTPFAANGQDKMDVLLDQLAQAIDAARFDQLRSGLAGIADRLPPTVSLTADSATVTAPGSVTVTAQATDASGIDRVEFFENGVLMETVAKPPYVALRGYKALDNGSKQISVRAYDKAGNVTIANMIIIVNITVVTPGDLVPPTVSLAAPATVTSSPVLLTATASDNTGVTRVEFYRGDTLKHTDSTAPYEFSDVLANTDNGTFVYTAKAYDLAGNVATSQPRVVTVNIPAPAWSIVDLGTLGGDYSYPTDINDAGDVVGNSTLDSGNTISRGFVFRGGQLQSLGTLGGAFSYANGINNLGEVVGFSIKAGDSRLSSFIYRNGVMQALDLPLAYQANDINDLGDIVGISLSYDAATRTTACITCVFFYSKGKLVDLGNFAPNTTPWAAANKINNAGQFAGSSGDRKYERRSYLYSGGVVTDLGELPRTGLGPWLGTSVSGMNGKAEIVGQSNSKSYFYSAGVMRQVVGEVNGAVYARGVNDAGQVVGMIQLATGPIAFLLNPGSTTFVNLGELPEVKAAGWKLDEAIAINASGQITGTGLNAQGQRRAFLLSPPR